MGCTMVRNSILLLKHQQYVITSVFNILGVSAKGGRKKREKKKREKREKKNLEMVLLFAHAIRHLRAISSLDVGEKKRGDWRKRKRKMEEGRGRRGGSRRKRKMYEEVVVEEEEGGRGRRGHSGGRGGRTKKRTRKQRDGQLHDENEKGSCLG
ncbi:hypothetical protein BHM03_00030993 [Ensete ventricosum]|nr:hypothetical protein BHM03_00030993 [Ensete ventricosum]